MKAADWVINQPWAITEEKLGTIIAIAERRGEDPEVLEKRLGRPLDNTRMVETHRGVAVIPVTGPISRYADLFTEISGATALETLARDFNTALNDQSVKAIVLNMDTPGGTVAGVAEFASHVREAKGKKPVVAYVGASAQSAGYWIASAADQVVVDPTAMVGSIGVVMGMRTKSGNSNTIEFVSSQSPYKRVDPTTESGKAQVQSLIDDLADVFVDAVATQRNCSREKVLTDFGQGGSLVGAKAVAAGMADGLGSLEHCIDCLSKGDYPFPDPSPNKPPARVADVQPRRAAMSEPIETISAAEAAELRKQIQALRAKADEGEAAKQAVATMAKDLEEIKAQNRQERELRITTEARMFAENEVRAGRASVPEREGIAQAFIEAARDDAMSPRQVSYAVAGEIKQGTRVEALRASFATRPVTHFAGARTTNEAIGSPVFRDGVIHFPATSGDPDPKVPTPERAAELRKLAGIPA